MEKWFCIVLGANLCSKGYDYARKAIQRLSGDCFVDFKMTNDGLGDDCYAFVKCVVPGNYMENFRQSKDVIMVLASFDKPTYISEEEVNSFLLVDNKEMTCLSYGDEVVVVGDCPYSGMHGLAVFAGCSETQVLFRFHMMSKRIWFRNDDLEKTGNVFSWLKFPVLGQVKDSRNRKHPVLEGHYLVSSSRPSREGHREDSE